MTFPHNFDYKQWSKATLETLRLSRRQAGALRWTQPGPDAAAGQQLPFYSALHAIVWRWLDGEMASDELSSASATQVKNGFEAGFVPRVILRDDPRATTSLAALPLLAYATVQVYHLTGDYNLLERMWPRVTAQHDWFDRRRDPDVDGLVRLADPVENPIDGSTETFDALRAADLDAVAHIAYDMGNSEAQEQWQARADAARAAVRGLWATAEGSAFRWAALFAECADDGQIVDLAESARDLPQDSMIVAWLAYSGLFRAGRKREASALAERSMRLLSDHGFYADYAEETGPAFPAAGLALDMFAREQQGGIPRPQCI